ncbi:hypothetical protein K1T71_006103 [Dendrolimus kikuchii]|uniref:Uncharacterized protein n=1 Tax=Dendrolimus kikuchii TaxID=765133 RepID=A0ACC1D3E4_9NEOP|nr:hypothetical protein K1T71_006103 [Dendrolimus kikuchii]
MSALSYISEYSSQSEESDCETQEIVWKRPRLPIPDLSFVSSAEEDIQIDLPHLHGGRIRSFPHVRGNWPTFVYVNYDGDSYHCLKAVNKLKDIVIAHSTTQDWQICEDFHISLSRTVVLKYHWINTFNKSLQKALSDFLSFDIYFSSVKVYCNEENSRTFISLEVDILCQKYLTNISKEVDKLLAEFKLPIFYEKPSFHMSILWANGNKKSDICKIVEELNDVLNQEMSSRTVHVDKVLCKIGNKLFQYQLI